MNTIADSYEYHWEDAMPLPGHIFKHNHQSRIAQGRCINGDVGKLEVEKFDYIVTRQSCCAKCSDRSAIAPSSNELNSYYEIS